jgi:hypothetical protein
MRLLAIISGEYGRRHVDNIRTHGPSDWVVEVWQAPSILPPMIDYPEDYLPERFPKVDLILSFAEHRGVPELIPDIAKMTGAKGVIAGVDSESWLPRGLARQLRGWLERMDVVGVTPKPLCSLTESDYMVARRKRIEYDNTFISEFARYFGQPDLAITVDEESRNISKAEVKRDAVCGCARYAAERLEGVSVDEAGESAGLLHHHYPCMASMGKDIDFSDTIMHVSGNLLKDNVDMQVRPYRQIRYIKPGKKN